MQAKVKISYNAAKLVRALPKMIENFIESSGISTADQSRKNIDSQKLFKPASVKRLHQDTIKSRNEGNYPFKKRSNKYKTNNIQPLRWTNNLYNNIKGTKKGIEMPTYGKLHNDGDMSSGIKRPKREFIELKIGEKAEKQFKSDLKRNFRK